MRSIRAASSPTLVEVLFGRYRRRILGLLLLKPGETFYVREIGRLADIPPGSLHRELSLLAEAGLLLRTPSGNQVRYALNPDCPIREELAAIFRKTTGLADVLRDALAPLGKRVQFACIFGSVAKGQERPSSDVDVLVVGSATFESVVAALGPAERSLGRPVNPVVMTRSVLKEKQASGDRFVSRLAREPRILLSGDDRELG